jgi:hypothetical protein
MREAAAQDREDFGFNISLQVRHPKLSTDELSKGLRLRPGRAWVAREERATPKGNPLPGLYKTSYCYYDLAKGLGADSLARKLSLANRRLQRHAALLRRWRKTGGTLHYYVTIHGRNAMGVEFDPQLLSNLAELGISLGLEALAARQRP